MGCARLAFVRALRTPRDGTTGGLYVWSPYALWQYRPREGKLAHRRPPDAVARRQTRRQIRPRPQPCFRHRLPGPGAALPDAEGTGPPQRPSHRGICHRLPRLAARRSRYAVPARPSFLQQSDIRFQGGINEDLGRDRGVGFAAGRTARRGQVRRRLRHVVRQGPRRRPHRRRFPPRQSGRHRQERRRAGADGRRPHRRILHHRAPVRISLHRRDDSGAQPGGRPGGARLRPVWLGDVALHRHLGGAEDDARDDRVRPPPSTPASTASISSGRRISRCRRAASTSASTIRS